MAEETYDVRVRPEEFGVGNRVWYRYPRRYIGRSPKWQKSYRPTGPLSCDVRDSAGELRTSEVCEIQNFRHPQGQAEETLFAARRV